jgi:hypothetical protein
MATFIFKFGREEFICQAGDQFSAMYQAGVFIDRECPVDCEYGWVPDTEGANIFRMSVGA